MLPCVYTTDPSSKRSVDRFYTTATSLLMAVFPAGTGKERRRIGHLLQLTCS